jgi:hypothetical protein
MDKCHVNKSSRITGTYQSPLSLSHITHKIILWIVRILFFTSSARKSTISLTFDLLQYFPLPLTSPCPFSSFSHYNNVCEISVSNADMSYICWLLKLFIWQYNIGVPQFDIEVSQFWNRSATIWYRRAKISEKVSSVIFSVEEKF